MILLKNTIFSELKKNIVDSNDIRLISAYLNSGFIELIKDINLKEKNFDLFIRGNKSDFIESSVCIDTLKYLHSIGFKCNLVKNLHAKLYLFDENIMYVGSSNLTYNGLFDTKDSNVEMLIKVSLTDEYAFLISEMLLDSIAITDELLSCLSQELENAKLDSTDSILEWKAINFDTHVKVLYLNDLPMCNLNEELNINTEAFCHDKRLFGLNTDKSIDINIFRNTRLNRYLEYKIEKNSALYFGQLKHLIKEQLFYEGVINPTDAEITTFVVNIYSYYKTLRESSELRIFYSRPKYSEKLSFD